MFLEKIIDGKRYSTKNATQLWSWHNPHGGYDLTTSVYMIYITMKGNYFMVFSENVNEAAYTNLNYLNLEEISEKEYLETMRMFECTLLDIKPISEEEAKRLIYTEAGETIYNLYFEKSKKPIIEDA